ncbi:unnamed protein product, partial [Nesidiocoris tenuis]
MEVFCVIHAPLVLNYVSSMYRFLADNHRWYPYDPSYSRSVPQRCRPVRGEGCQHSRYCCIYFI